MTKAASRCRSSFVILPLSQVGRIPKLGTTKVHLSCERSGKCRNLLLGLVMLLDGLLRVVSFGCLSVNLTGAFTMRRAQTSWQRSGNASSSRVE